MLHIVHIEEIQALLLDVPRLVDVLDSRDPVFPDLVKEWLSKMSDVLTANRLPVASEVATLRGTLINAQRGITPPGIMIQGKSTARKVRDAVGLDVLRRAADTVTDAIRNDTAQVAEGERLIRQILSVATRKGVLGIVEMRGDTTSRLQALWYALSTDPDVGPATAHLSGLVGQNDALILLDRALTHVAA